MPETTGTRPLSWYAEQAPDYLDGEEEDRDADDRAERREIQRAKLLRCVRRSRGNE